jgi:hypothetical protein
MDEPEDPEPREDNSPKTMETPRPRAVGSPLPKGDPTRPPAPTPILQGAAIPVPPLTTSPVEETIEEEMPQDPTQPSSIERAVKGVRMALPFVQKILPLLDGQVITTIAHLLGPRTTAAPVVNLASVEGSLAELQTQQRKMREQLSEQNTSLQKVEDRLEMVREATDRNTLEQQELLEDLKSMRGKVTVLAVISILLLLVSVGINVVLFLYLRGILK